MIIIIFFVNILQQRHHSSSSIIMFSNILFVTAAAAGGAWHLFCHAECPLKIVCQKHYRPMGLNVLQQKKTLSLWRAMALPKISLKPIIWSDIFKLFAIASEILIANNCWTNSHLKSLVRLKSQINAFVWVDEGWKRGRGVFPRQERLFARRISKERELYLETFSLFLQVHKYKHKYT